MEGTSRGDHGFTLIEMLLVVIVLGVLSSVVIFAARGIAADADESACSTDLRTLVTAQEAHAARYADTIGTEADLVAAGLLREESELWDITLDSGGNYSIAPAPGSVCTGGTTG